MKILQIVHGFPPLSNAGTEKYTYFLSKELAKRHEVHVLYPTSTGKYLEITSSHEEPTLIRHEMCLTKAAMQPVDAVKAYIQFDYSYMNEKSDMAFECFVQKIQPDIIHFQHLLNLSSGFISVANRLGIPSIITLHDYWFSCPTVNLYRYTKIPCDGPESGMCRDCWSRLREKSLQPFTRNGKIAEVSTAIWWHFNSVSKFAKRQNTMLNILSEIDQIVAPSRFLREWFIQCGIHPDKIVQIENGYNTDLLKVTRKRKKTFGKLRFGFVGRLEHIKGLHTLIDAFMQIPEEVAELYIYGSYDVNDPYIMAQQEKIRPRKDIKLVGFTHDISSAYTDMDVLVFPSLWYENCPLTLAECRILRIPVIASNIGAIPEFVNDGINGLLFEAGNADELRARIMTIISNPQMLNEFTFGDNLHPPTIEHHTQRIELVYEKLVLTK